MVGAEGVGVGVGMGMALEGGLGGGAEVGADERGEGTGEGVGEGVGVKRGGEVAERREGMAFSWPNQQAISNGFKPIDIQRVD